MRDPLKLFSEVLEDFEDDSKWSDATFGKIKIISNSKVGNAGQVFVERLCDQLSIPCLFPIDLNGKQLTQSPWDIEISGIKFELKTATEDTSKKFQFNHIRYHRPYDAVLCLGVSPENLHFGVWTKGDLATNKAGTLVTMEKGANASYKLTKDPKQLHKIDDFKPVIEKFLNDFK